MAEFRAEIGALMVQQPGHFRGENFKIEDLTGGDGAIWQEIKNGTLTKPELEEYAKEAKESGVPSRLTFLAMVNNKATGIFLEREVERRKENA